MKCNVYCLGLPPGLVSSAGLLAGLPPVSSAAAFAAQMARLPTPLLNHMEASKREEEAKSVSSTPLGPHSAHSDERHVRLFFEFYLLLKFFFLKKKYFLKKALWFVCANVISFLVVSKTIKEYILLQLIDFSCSTFLLF